MTKEPAPQTAEYRCPGEPHPISRAVHLGRLAAFYSACRQCRHRDDTGTLSPRQVAQLDETARQCRPPSVFHDEGAGGVYLNDLTPAAAREIAAAFGVMLQEGRGLDASASSESAKSEIRNPKSEVSNPSVVLAGDGRALTAELVAAVGEGLRYSGCDLLDIGPATAACLALAVHSWGKMGTGTSPDAGRSGSTCHGSEPVPVFQQAAGGVLVGNPGDEPHQAGLKFWVAGPQPLSAGGSLEPLVELVQTWGKGTVPFSSNENWDSPRDASVPFSSNENWDSPPLGRPARRFGASRRLQADGPYLALMAQYYHAIRPLRVVVDSASKPLVGYLERLAAAVACEIIPCRSARGGLPERVRAAAAHFAARIDGDGETCRVLDEQGREIPAERLLLFLAVNAGGDSSRRSWLDDTNPTRKRGTEMPAVLPVLPSLALRACVVLESGSSRTLI
jgi:hypothetical protein